jgi:hypothetical protein
MRNWKRAPLVWKIPQQINFNSGRSLVLAFLLLPTFCFVFTAYASFQTSVLRAHKASCCCRNVFFARFVSERAGRWHTWTMFMWIRRAWINNNGKFHYERMSRESHYAAYVCQKVSNHHHNDGNQDVETKNWFDCNSPDLSSSRLWLCTNKMGKISALLLHLEETQWVSANSCFVLSKAIAQNVTKWMSITLK